eukprot:3737641-Rhodomonas_salina.4
MTGSKSQKQAEGSFIRAGDESMTSRTGRGSMYRIREINSFHCPRSAAGSRKVAGCGVLFLLIMCVPTVPGQSDDTPQGLGVWGGDPWDGFFTQDGLRKSGGSGNGDVKDAYRRNGCHMSKVAYPFPVSLSPLPPTCSLLFS